MPHLRCSQGVHRPDYFEMGREWIEMDYYFEVGRGVESELR